MEGEKENIRKLFEKYLSGDCTPQEESTIMAYFDQIGHEEYIRELIREEFDKDIRIRETSEKAVASFLRDSDWLPDRSEAKGIIRLWAYIIRPGVAAAWLGGIFCLATVFYLYYGKTLFSDANLSYSVTASGERKEIILSDGSVVWLNAASKLTYPEHFSSERREVFLDGEAFFDVTPNADVPFVIRSGTLKTTVLGTSFNIRAYREDKTVSVAVVTGKVAVASPETELYLTPNQQAVFDKTRGKLDKRQESSASEMASWREGVLQFRNTTFSEMTTVLRRSRGVDITYDPRLENCPIIHADFNESDSVESILKTLMLAVSGRVEKPQEGVYFLRSTIDCYR